jgi:hypothetical protein
MRSSSVVDRLVGWILPVAAIVAEGALLTVLYIAVQVTIDHQVPLLGTLEFSLAAGALALAVRRGWFDPDEEMLAFLGSLFALGLVGWMWDERVRTALATDPFTAIALHPGGWLLVAAGMRGVTRAIEIDDRSMTRLVLIGIPALAFPWALGQLAAGPLSTVFTDQAFVASITFVTAGFIAAGLARLQEIGRDTGVDWRRNRSWLGTVLGVLVVVLAIGIPASVLLGLPSDAVARGILGPLVGILGYLYLGSILLIGLTAFLLANLLRSIGVGLPGWLSASRPGAPFGIEPITIEQMRGPMTWLVVGWIVVVVVVVVLATLWIRRRKPRGQATGDERSIRIPQRSTQVRMPRAADPRSGAWSRPRDAVTAYLAALADLGTADPTAARALHETPRAHARRVAAGAELASLQADYALARYGGRTLSDAEHRRAIGRWARLRRRLGIR